MDSLPYIKTIINSSFTLVNGVEIKQNSPSSRYVSRGVPFEIRVSYKLSTRHPQRICIARGYSCAGDAISEALQFAYCVEKFIGQKRYDSLDAYWVDIDEGDMRANHVIDTNGNKHYWEFTADEIKQRLGLIPTEVIPIGIDNIDIRELTEEEENNRLTIIRLTEKFISKPQYLVLLKQLGEKNGTANVFTPHIDDEDIESNEAQNWNGVITEILASFSVMMETEETGAVLETEAKTKIQKIIKEIKRRKKAKATQIEELIKLRNMLNKAVHRNDMASLIIPLPIASN